MAIGPPNVPAIGARQSSRAQAKIETARRLLRHASQRKLAAAHALGELLGEIGDLLLAIGGDELLECGEQRGVGDTGPIDAVEDGVLPGLQKMVERRVALIFGGDALLQGIDTVKHEPIPRRNSRRGPPDRTARPSSPARSWARPPAAAQNPIAVSIPC